MVVHAHHQGNVLCIQAGAPGDEPKQVDAENRGLVLKQLTLTGIDDQARLLEIPGDLLQPLNPHVEIDHLLAKRVSVRRHHQNMSGLAEQ